MRLLKASTLKLEYFSDDRKLPKYAILSHTWDADQEVLFHDIDTATAAKKAGYKKLQYSCQQAQADALEYIWIDTCCIDTSSSAELSEAINSMYAWYHKAEKCYAYLADFPLTVPSLTKSKWFTRGWTLQELIAPKTVIFYSCDWVKLGTKWTLRNEIVQRTRIDVEILSGKKALASMSVARRMSWACNRETTRLEDEAYCLMGIFDVNMPMLYGEGSKAFLRLQEEIMKNSDDKSLFAWTDPDADPKACFGLLASTPKYFEGSSDILPFSDWDGGWSAPFSTSNKGLRVDFHLTPENDLWVASLDCPSSLDSGGFLGIYLKRLPKGKDQFARVRARSLSRRVHQDSVKTVYVRQSHAGTARNAEYLYPLLLLQLRRGPQLKFPEVTGYRAVKAAATQQLAPELMVFKLAIETWFIWEGMQSVFRINPVANQLAVAVLFERHDGKRLVVLFGIRKDLTIGFSAITVSNLENLDDIGALQPLFEPKGMGTNIILEDHQVRVTIERQEVARGVEYYTVDFDFNVIYPSENQTKSALPLGLRKLKGALKSP